MNPARRSQQHGRDRLARLSQQWEEADDRLGVQRSRFARLADPGAAPRVVSSFNLFQTPEELAARAVAMLGDVRGPVLEPSAGLGRLYRALRAVAPAVPVVLVDVSPECCGELYRVTEGDAGARLMQGDFLSMAPGSLGTVGAVLMNPPFKMGTDIRHIRHALEHLSPGGRLVAFCYNGTRQRAALMPLASEWVDLEPGAFKSEGTNACAALLVIDKPNAGATPSQEPAR
jgi:hypothetical protein